MFENYAVKNSKIGHTPTSDLYCHDDYLGTYASVQDLMIDLAFKWDCQAFKSSPLSSWSGCQIPRYRGVFRRNFAPIDFQERLVVFSDSLVEVLDYLVKQDDFCQNNSQYFSSQGTGIHRFDDQTKAYEFWKGGADNLSELTDLIIDLRESGEVKKNEVLIETNRKLEFDIFISKKSSDYPLAKSLYDYLVQQGCSVFLSEESLPNIGSAEYMKEIDVALESSKHMIVVGSNVNNITSSWVEAEWRVFINELRAGRKKGNILSVITDNIEPKELPMSLRYYEVIPFCEDSFERVYGYVKGSA